MFTVKVGVLPGAIKEFVVAEGSTVGDLLGLAELDANGYSIMRKGATVDVATTLQDGDVVILSKMVKGN